MSVQSRTPGETLFEQYLATQHIEFEFEKEYSGKSKKPDYTISWNGQPIVFDVKDFDPPSRYPTGFGQFDPYPPIREKIEQGREKFKQYKEFCCGLVLRNLGHPFVRLENANILLGAMYGDSGFRVPVNTNTGVGDVGKMNHAFLGRGKMIRPNWSQPQNTTISAIITLTVIRPHFQLLLEMVRRERNRDIADCEAELERTTQDYDPNREVPRVIVWHNAVARISFPADLFSGLYDTHLGIVRVDGESVEQSVTYRGPGLPETVLI